MAGSIKDKAKKNGRRAKNIIKNMAKNTKEKLVNSSETLIDKKPPVTKSGGGLQAGSVARAINGVGYGAAAVEVGRVIG